MSNLHTIIHEVLNRYAGVAFTIIGPDLHIRLEQICANPVFRPAASCKVPGKGTIVQLQINHL